MWDDPSCLFLCNLSQPQRQGENQFLPPAEKNLPEGQHRGARRGTELSHSPLHPTSTMKWVISFREGDRNKNKDELKESKMETKSIPQAVCVSEQYRLYRKCYTRSGISYFCASVFPVVKRGDKVHLYLLEIWKGRARFCLEHREYSVTTPLQNASHPLSISKAKMTEWPL